jgi:hypothetical protein
VPAVLNALFLTLFCEPALKPSSLRAVLPSS